MRVLVLGHTGMLGAAVAAHFRAKHHEVRTLVEGLRYGDETDAYFLEQCREQHPEVVINCIGAIPQRGADAEEMFVVNAQLPNRLVGVMPKKCVIVHASTDCVFRGTRGMYRECDVPDAVEPYGASKVEGDVIAQAPNALVIRTSIVGKEGKVGLLNWFLSQPKNSILPGFTNHRWNGITTKRWAAVADTLLQQGKRGLVHVASTGAVSKYGLLMMFAELFRPDINVEQTRAPEKVDRTLHANVMLPHIHELLKELR